MQATSGYSADTEILTRHGGWVTFDQLTYMDEVATRSPDGRFEWQMPERIQAERYRGSLWHFASKSVNLLVAPDHLLLINPNRLPVKASRPGWKSSDRSVVAHYAGARIQRAGPGALMGIPAMSTWDAPDLEAFRLPVIGRRDRRNNVLPGDDFAAFMGMYLAEGCVTLIPQNSPNYRVTLIAQQVKSKGFVEYHDLLRRMLGRDPLYVKPGVFRFGWQPLSDYLVRFGQALDKWIPSEILEMPRRQLAIFWHYYLLGDGCRRSDDGRESIRTSSSRMADGLQEVVQKLGSSASVCSWRFKDDVHWPDGRVTPASRLHLSYVIQMRKARVHRITRATPVDYEGLIHRVRVSNGVIYVRRGGRPAWCGAG